MDNPAVFARDETTPYARAHNDAQRFADVQSEGTTADIGGTYITELEYRQRLAACIVAEFSASNKQRSMENELEQWHRNNLGSAPDWIMSIHDRADAECTDQQRAALQAMNPIVEMMRRDGYHHGVIYSAISTAVPIALNTMRETRMKQHASASKPKIKARGNAEIYSGKTIDKYGCRGMI